MKQLLESIIAFLPLEVLITIIAVFVLSMIAFLLIDRFYRKIDYKAHFIYHIEFMFFWWKIEEKLKENPEAKTDLRTIIIITIVYSIGTIYLFFKLLSLGGYSLSS